MVVNNMKIEISSYDGERKTYIYAKIINTYLDHYSINRRQYNEMLLRMYPEIEKTHIRNYEFRERWYYMVLHPAKSTCEYVPNLYHNYEFFCEDISNCSTSKNILII